MESSFPEPRGLFETAPLLLSLLFIIFHCLLSMQRLFFCCENNAVDSIGDFLKVGFFNVLSQLDSYQITAV